MKRILFITSFKPDNDTAGQAFTLRLLQDIGHDHLVDLYYFDTSATSFNPNVKNVTNIGSERLTLFRRIIGAITIPFLHPLFTCRFSIKNALYFRSIASNYDVIYFDFSQVFLYSLFISHRNKIGLAHDIVTQMYQRKSFFFYPIITFFCRFSEWFILRNANLKLYCFSEKDCNLVSQYFNTRANNVDFYLDQKLLNINIDSVEKHDKFVFYGAWARRENSYGLLWFFENVLPLVKPKIRFIVVGTGIGSDLRDAGGKFGDLVEFTGFVDNPYTQLASAQALIAPLFEGAGVKVKVIESLACGTPIIGTAVSFEGIADRYLSSCSVCTTAHDFADAINNFKFFDNAIIRNSFLSTYPALTMGQILRNSYSHKESKS